MTYQELLTKVKSGSLTELPALYSGRIFQIRFHNRRLETLAPAAGEWRSCSNQVLMSEFGIGGLSMPQAGDALDLDNLTFGD